MHKLLLAAVCLLPIAAHAEQCSDNGAAMAMLGKPYTEIMQFVKANCRPGDTLKWPTASVALIADTCDLDKQVVHAAGIIICQRKHRL